MIAAIDHGDADRRPGKGANGLEPAESGADHDHMMTVQGRVHAILFTVVLVTGFATSLHEPHLMQARRRVVVRGDPAGAGASCRRVRVRRYEALFAADLPAKRRKV